MKKKLLIVHHSSVIGGAGISLFNLIGLIKEDYEITVYVSDLRNDYYDFLKGHGIQVKTYKGRIAALYYHASNKGILDKAFWYRLLLIFKQFKFWDTVLKKEDSDLVIVNSLVLSWFGILIKKNKLKGLCFVRETFSDRENIITKVQRKLLARFTGVSFISQFDLKKANLPSKVRTYINHNYIIPKGGKKTPFFKNDVFSVLYLGGISKIKGIEVVVEAANILKKHKNIRFDIVGEDYRNFSISRVNFNENIRLVKKIKDKIKDLGLERNIVFHGIKKDMEPFFRSCNVLVCPITLPHQQRGIFEAGWYSKPVIVSNFKQLHWAVEDGVNGTFFEVGNSKSLADKIFKLYKNKDLGVNQGKENNKKTLKNHTMEQCNKRVISMLKNIINEER